MGDARRLRTGSGFAVVALLLAACGGGGGAADARAGDSADAAATDTADPGAPGDDLPGVPDVFDVPDVSDTPDGPDAPDTPDTPDVPDAQDVPDAPDPGGLAVCPGTLVSVFPGECAVPGLRPPEPDTSCEVDADCHDGMACTTERCVEGACVGEWAQPDCCPDSGWCQNHDDDGDPCTDEVCSQVDCLGGTRCVHVPRPGCTQELPRVWTFDRVSWLGDPGWTVVDGGTEAACHWRLDRATPAGLGPDTHIAFDPQPATSGVRSFLVSPPMDAGKCQQNFYNYLGVTTLQWRMLYRHAEPGTTVTLKVVAFQGADLAQGTVLWTVTTDIDVAYDLHSVELPDGLKFRPDLHVAFGVDTGTGSTAAMGTLQIDDVVLACHRSNVPLRSKVFRCPADSSACNPVTGTEVATGEAPAALPDLVVEPCAWYRAYLCLHDADARYFTWQYFGFPGTFIDTPPLQDPGFMAPARDVGGSYGCETAGFAVAALCGTDSAVPGYFYCAMDVDVPCDATPGRAWDVGMVVRDDWDPGLPLYGPLESLSRFRLEIATPPAPDPPPEPAPEPVPDA